jgi:hypothetical protein
MMIPETWEIYRFVLTNKRLMVNGLVTGTVGMMPLVRVTGMKYRRQLLGLAVVHVSQRPGLRRAVHLRRPRRAA